MADERISSVIAERAFDEVDRMQEKLVSLEKLIQSFDLQLGDTKSISQANGLLSELAVNTAKVTEAVKQQTAATQANAKANKDDLNYQKELDRQAKANEKTLLALEKAKQRDAKISREASSATIQLRKAYQDAQLRASDYALTLGKLHPITLQAQADARQMADVLSDLSARAGNFRDNVGNYNAVGAQFNQLLREAPNAGISFRTFIMSLTNNVTYFGEAIKDARAQGQSWGSIIKTLGGALFSFTGVLNIAIAAVTYWSLNSEKASDETKTLTERIDDLTESMLRNIKAANEQVQLIDDAFDQGSRAQQRYIDLLISQGATEQKINDARKKFHDIRIGEYNQQINKYNDVEKAVLRYAKAAQRGTDDFYKAESELNKLLTGNLGLSEEQAKTEADKIKSVARELNDNTKSLSLDNFVFLQRITNERLLLEENIKDELSAIEVEKYNTQKYYADKRKKDAEQEEKERKEALKRMREYDRSIPITRMDTSSQIEFKRRTEAFRQSASDIEGQTVLLMQNLERQYANGEIDFANYEKQKTAITRGETLARLKAELQYAKDTVNLVYNPALREEAIKRINKLELDIIATGNEEKKDKYKEDVKNNKESLKKKKEELEKFSKEISVILQATNTIFSELAGIQSDQLQNRINQLQKEGKLIQENSDREIKRIQNSALSEEEKQKAIREQEALTESQRLANEARLAEAAKRKASFDKAANISNIITSGALAVIKAYVDSGPIGAGIAAAAVAAQLARAASAPVPQYEKGTLNHPGGRFIAGEKESELVVTPHGKAYWTDDKPTMYNEPKGTQVFNTDMIHALLGAGLTPRLMSVVDRKTDTNAMKMAEIIEDAIERTGKNTVRAIYQNRAVQNVNVTQADLYYLSKVRGKA